MSRTLQSRVSRIEAASPEEPWREWAERDPQELTDEMLEAVLRGSLRAEGIEPPETFTDEHLQDIIEGKAV
jgi:hypothetical protein